MRILLAVLAVALLLPSPGSGRSCDTNVTVELRPLARVVVGTEAHFETVRPDGCCPPFPACNLQGWTSSSTNWGDGVGFCTTDGSCPLRHTYAQPGRFRATYGSSSSRFYLPEDCPECDLCQECGGAFHRSLHAVADIDVWPEHVEGQAFIGVYFDEAGTVCAADYEQPYTPIHVVADIASLPSARGIQRAAFRIQSTHGVYGLFALPAEGWSASGDLQGDGVVLTRESGCATGDRVLLMTIYVTGSPGNTVANVFVQKHLSDASTADGPSLSVCDGTATTVVEARPRWAPLLAEDTAWQACEFDGPVALDRRSWTQVKTLYRD